MKKALRVLFVIVLTLLIIVVGIGIYVKAALPNVGVAPTLTVTATPERIVRGKYLANHVAVCMDCHSQRNWNFYAGPVMEGTFGAGGEKFGKEMQFPGTLYSKNITPYGLHNWTDGEIFKAITTGETKGGKALFPLMGYPAYGKMDQEDVYSIIAYIRTLPAIKNEVPERSLDFPLNFIVNTIPSKAALSTRPDTNNRVAYGQYLVATANCIECHTQVDKGKLIAGTEFGGGRSFYFPNGTVATSPNITPDKETGIGGWNEQAFMQKFKQYTDTAYRPQQVGPHDFNTPMPWLMYAGMTDQDLGAVYAYLQTLKPIRNSVTKFTRTAP